MNEEDMMRKGNLDFMDDDQSCLAMILSSGEEKKIEDKVKRRRMYE